VFAGVRKEADGQALVAEASDRLRPLTIDVADGESIATAARAVEEALGDEGLAGLHNNAGIAVPGPLEFVPIERLRKQIEVNLIGQVAVTQAFLALIRKAKGRILFTSSMGGRVAFPLNGPYHASKYGIEAIADTLRQELRPWGIEVVLIEPGSIATDIWERGKAEADEIVAELPPEGRELYGEAIEAGVRVSMDTGARGIAPEKVAEVVERALTSRRPKTRYLVGLDAKALVRIGEHTPDRLFDRLVARQFK
jgi:NAD(P)-dependent dehydrogenase (short-subunit alcohol dehydrogenase family)